MNFIDFIVYPLVYILFTPILTMIHELGHAIPALIFTKGDVSVHPKNIIAIDIYNNIGFSQEITPYDADDEIFLKYKYKL